MMMTPPRLLAFLAFMLSEHALLRNAQASTAAPGCYVDGPAPHRLLPYMPMKNMDPHVDVETCNAGCAAKNYCLLYTSPSPRDS